MKWLFRTFFKTLRLILGPVLLLRERLSAPQGLVRSPEAQRRVDKQCRDLALYQFKTCPFCIKVRQEMRRLSLAIELRDVQHDPVHREALRQGGGRTTVPCLRMLDNRGNSRWLYESAAIIDYLGGRFGQAVDQAVGQTAGQTPASKTPSSVPAKMISKEAIAQLPIRRYEGEVCLVATAEALERAMADIRQERVAGFDTETRPAFTKGESHLPCLVQVATARAVYLFQLQQLDCSAALAELLAAPHIVKTGVALAHDLRQLKLVFPITPAAVLDLGSIAKRHGVKQTGLRNLAGIFLAFRIPKGTSTSNWASPRLSAAQINYAATDAWASRELYLHFENRGLLAPGMALSME